MYSTERFKEWLSFIRTIPWSSNQIFEHVTKILLQMRIEHIIESEGKPSLVTLFIERMLVSEFGIRKEDKGNYINLLVNEVISNE